MHVQESNVKVNSSARHPKRSERDVRRLAILKPNRGVITHLESQILHCLHKLFGLSQNAKFACFAVGQYLAQALFLNFESRQQLNYKIHKYM